MEDNFYNGDYYERHHYSGGGYWSLQRVAFTFTNGRGQVLQRLDFTVNPSSMQYNQGDRNVFVKTLGRYPAMQGYGADLHTIQISGQTGYHKTAIMDEGPTGKDTNYGQAKRLKRLLFADINQSHDDFVGGGVGNHANTQLHFLNYTDGDCYQVEMNPQGVQFSRTNNDPLTYYYTISMVVIRKLTDPLPSDIIPTTFGNVHTLLPTVINAQQTKQDRIYNIPYNVLPFNELYHHLAQQPNLAKAVKNGRGSILNPIKKKNINTLENKDDEQPNPSELTIPQKVKIMSTIDNQNNISHKINLGPVNAKIDPSDPKDEVIYWTKWLQGNNNQMSGIKPVKVKNSSHKPLPKTPAQPAPSVENTPVLPAFVGVTDGNSVHVIIPKQNFEQIKPQATPLKQKPAYYNKRFFRNTKTNNTDKVISNLVNGNLTVSEVVSDSFGNLTIEPVSTDISVPQFQEELVTITDQNKDFVIQPNQFSPDDVAKSVDAKATNISSDYAEFYLRNSQLVMILNGKQYTNITNTFILSDLNNQMEVNTDINPQADNWLKVSLNSGNIYITPSGPEDVYNNRYYVNGANGSHTIFDNCYMIVPNNDKNNSVYEAITKVNPYQYQDAYSAQTHKSKRVHYGLDNHGNIHLVNINGNIQSFSIDNSPVSNKPKLDLSMKYKITHINPDDLEGQTSKDTIETLKGDDNK